MGAPAAGDCETEGTASGRCVGEGRAAAAGRAAVSRCRVGGRATARGGWCRAGEPTGRVPFPRAAAGDPPSASARGNARTSTRLCIRGKGETRGTANEVRLYFDSLLFKYRYREQRVWTSGQVLSAMASVNDRMLRWDVPPAPRPLRHVTGILVVVFTPHACCLREAAEASGGGGSARPSCTTAVRALAVALRKCDEGGGKTARK